MTEIGFVHKVIADLKDVSDGAMSIDGRDDLDRSIADLEGLVENAERTLKDIRERREMLDEAVDATIDGDGMAEAFLEYNKKYEVEINGDNLSEEETFVAGMEHGAEMLMRTLLEEQVLE